MAGDQRAGSLEDLRRIVIGPEQSRLERLEARALPTADTVGDVLPDAVVRTTERAGQRLALALEPLLKTSVRNVARDEPELFGEILAPTIGAAVRKAVRDAIAAMLQRFNQALEQSFSIRSIEWRLEARRTDRPFAEVVLLHTLVYRVEQVFLIHPETGLALEHVAAEGVSVEEPDQVASMLEAINSFAREAFRSQTSSTDLSHFELGDLAIWVDRGPSVAVAAVVRGIAPHSFCELLQETRARIALACQADLACFRSDVAPFRRVRPALERCLHEQRRSAPRRAQILIAIVGALALVGLAVLLVRERARATEEARLLHAYVDTLQTEPGVVVTSARRVDGRIQVAGLRDPLAAAPAELLTRRGLEQADMNFRPFHSLDPRVIEERARRVLRPPPSVKLALRDGTLRASGSAQRAFIERARLLAPTLAGIDRYDDAELRPDQASDGLRASAAALATIEIPFAYGSSEFSAASLERAAARVREVIGNARSSRREVCIAVLGHTDPRGPRQANVELSRARANRVAEALSARAAPKGSLRPTAAGVWKDATNAEQARSVTFRVDIGTRCSEAR